ncbi:LuxR family transcriptional regulator [Novosphingobium sp. RD2P27]|uniref:LuxR family transcriptional regulator n=1 Tax=Novosphingobium kalidii TaxID=3230299 RepID=A0ABV2D4B8_9SPHN
MPLTSRDETDLLLPLFDGGRENAPFSTLLERLRRRTRSIYVSLTIRLSETPDPYAFFVGPDIHKRAHELELHDLNLTDRVQYDLLRPGRVYSGDEFDAHDPALRARRARDMRKLGLVDERVVRVLDEDLASAWLIIASDRPCTATDSALLSSLAPYAAAALRTFIAAERQTLTAILDAESLERTGTGWMIFDKSGRLLTLAPSTERSLQQIIGHAPRCGQPLRELGPSVARELGEAAARFAADPGGDDATIVLHEATRMEAILRAAPSCGHLMHAPVMIAHCHQPRKPEPRRITHLARLYDLPIREAELAILLADGMSLAEASGTMGLTIETTRNYSKRLFAKIGVRGQPELVSAVFQSCVMLA